MDGGIDSKISRSVRKLTQALKFFFFFLYRKSRKNVIANLLGFLVGRNKILFVLR